jgi:hypothetical protein
MIQKFNYDPFIKSKSNIEKRLCKEYKTLLEFEEYLESIHPTIKAQFVFNFDNLMKNRLNIQEFDNRKYVYFKYSLSFCKDIDLVEPYLKDFIRVIKYPIYHYYQVFIKIYGRERGIYHIKYFIDVVMKDKYPNINKPEDLSYLMGNSDSKLYPTESFGIMVNKGKVCNRITRCLWHEVLSRCLHDKEVAYLTSCYWDFMNFESLGKYFHITRSKCLMLGDSYCDPCSWDLRYNDIITHPSSEFFEKLKF